MMRKVYKDVLNFRTKMKLTRRKFLALAAISLGGIYTTGKFFSFLGPEGWNGLKEYYKNECKGFKQKDG